MGKPEVVSNMVQVKPFRVLFFFFFSFIKNVFFYVAKVVGEGRKVGGAVRDLVCGSY